jgi:TonB family protein
MKPRDVRSATPGTPGASSESRDPLARWLIQRAARHSPSSLCQRLEEEWLADLAAQKGSMSRLRFAMGCCWATTVIAYDHFGSGALAAGSGAERVSAATFLPQDVSFLSRRTSLFFLIVCLHAVAIYGFASGLAHRVIEVMPPLMKTTILNPTRTHDLPAAIPEPRLAAWRTVEPKLDTSLEVPSLSSTIRDEGGLEQQLPSSPPSSPKAVTRVLGGPGRGFPNTGDYYPAASRRIGETGLATVRVCVDDNGRLISDPTIQQSSGSTRLDQGALDLAKAGSGHYRSTTEDGNPVIYCYPFRIRFELKE